MGSEDNVWALVLHQLTYVLGQLSTYKDNPEDYFGVEDVGLPHGCQVEQAHSLQRHAQRFPTGEFDDGPNDDEFAQKVFNFTQANSNAGFTGPLTFLNSYKSIVGRAYLTGLGGLTEYQSGITFWNRYGRTLFNASVGQVKYNASYDNGTARPKPVLRTTSQSRIWNSAISWALGFFGPSIGIVPDPSLAAFTNNSLFDVVVITEGDYKNNTLASYDSCYADFIENIYDIGDRDLMSHYVPLYLRDATKRMNEYAPKGFQFTVNDTYAMQSLCAYETGFIGDSAFCALFTEKEWAGFENTLDIEYYYDYAWGNPNGRAQGLGYLQELIARLTNQYITSSNSSVNSTLDDNAAQFPLGSPFYADFTHDDIIISLFTAMSLDYFKDPPSLTEYPPDPRRHFILSHLTPFGARLVTEVIGCASLDPKENPVHDVQYYPTQYGYDPQNSPHKFIRMRLNNGIVPLESIRGGKCSGRTDGLCGLDDFLESQKDAEVLANYEFACFANYTLKEPLKAVDYDGTVSNTSDTINVFPGTLTEDYVSKL